MWRHQHEHRPRMLGAFSAYWKLIGPLGRYELVVSWKCCSLVNNCGSAHMHHTSLFFYHQPRHLSMVSLLQSFCLPPPIHPFLAMLRNLPMQARPPLMCPESSSVARTVLILLTILSKKCSARSIHNCQTMSVPRTLFARQLHIRLNMSLNTK